MFTVLLRSLCEHTKCGRMPATTCEMLGSELLYVYERQIQSAPLLCDMKTVVEFVLLLQGLFMVIVRMVQLHAAA